MPNIVRLSSVSLIALMCAGAALAAGAAQKTSVPDFQSGNVSWTAINSDFTGVPGGPQPVGFDPKFPFVRNDEANVKNPATYRVADLSNPNLKPWVAGELKKWNDKVFAGEIGTTPRWQCLPGGVPGFSIFVVEPVYFVQGPKEVLLIYQGNQEVRHVYLDIPHSANPKPSWYGESVGHYEGDALVVDTIGLSPKAVIDNYHTPHTEQLHVIERYHVIEGGKKLQVDLTVDDPGAFNAPWRAVQTYDRTMRGPLPEVKCVENNDNIFNLPGFLGSPMAEKPDF
jgi:hypothetical protein